MISRLEFKKIPKRTIQFLLKPIRPYTNNFIYTMRSGPAKGLKRKGGFAFIPSTMTLEDKFFQTLDLSSKIIYDIGANIGIMSIFFANKCGKNGVVYSFEPNPNSVKLIETHKQINNFSNIEIFNIAVGEAEYESELVMHKQKRGSASLESGIVEHFKNKGNNVIFKVKVKSLDKLIETEKMESPDFIKIDVEGYEYNCLLGMNELLKSKKPDLYIEMHGVGEIEKYNNAKKVCEYLLSLDYKISNIEFEKNIINNFKDAKRGHLYCTSN